MRKILASLFAICLLAASQSFAADKILDSIKGKPLEDKLRVLLNPSGGYDTEFMNWMSKRKYMGETIRFISDAEYRKKDKKLIYDTYFPVGAKQQINIGGDMRKVYTDLAAKGEYQKMDWTAPLQQMKKLEKFSTIVDEYLAEKSPAAAAAPASAPAPAGAPAKK